MRDGDVGEEENENIDEHAGSDVEWEWEDVENAVQDQVVLVDNTSHF